MQNLKDKLWLWGHPANSLKNEFGLTQDSFVTPAEGAAYLGANNIFYVPMCRKVDRAECTREMQHAAQIGWSIEKEQDIYDLIQMKEEFSNITIAIFDDFFNPENNATGWTNYSIEKLIALREQLHQAGIEMWVVLYTRLLEMDIAEYLRVFDGISYWYWHETDEADFVSKMQWLFDNAPAQKKLVGCYLYDFGNSRPIQPETVRYQLDRNFSYLQEGKIEGMILHTNAVGGMGFVAYEEAKHWVDQHDT